MIPGPQMIPDRKWSPYWTANDPDQKIRNGMNWYKNDTQKRCFPILWEIFHSCYFFVFVFCGNLCTFDFSENRVENIKHTYPWKITKNSAVDFISLWNKRLFFSSLVKSCTQSSQGIRSVPSSRLFMGVQPTGQRQTRNALVCDVVEIGPGVKDHLTVSPPWELPLIRARKRRKMAKLLFLISLLSFVSVLGVKDQNKHEGGRKNEVGLDSAVITLIDCFTSVAQVYLSLMRSFKPKSSRYY